MRICLVHEEYPEETNFGGIATYQKAMAEELVKEGHIVYVICRSLLQDNNYIENGINIFRIFVDNTNNQIYNYTLYRKKVAELLLEWQNKNLIDIIEVPDWGAETIFFEKNRKIPLVVRLHTPLLVWLKYNKNNFGKVKSKLLEWEMQMIHSADLLTCCSSALKKIIIKDFKIDSARVIVTPNPANITHFFRNEKIKKEQKIIYVGSLEERKGVCVLANSLNIVFKKYPTIKIDFIGKDTKRNNKNISTKELIYTIVNERYRGNVNFLGHICNYELNKYLNSALVGVYPSLFDNFPYVVLESMASGMHIVGSSNSGMVEMLNDESSISKAGNVDDLALKIIEKYELSLNENISQNNINRVKEMYNPKTVCEKMVNMYKDTINNYYDIKVNKEDLQNVLNVITVSKINKIMKEKGGAANLVFRVITDSNTYIIKKYFYKYNFALAKKLYKVYSKSDINVICPINKKIITYKGFNYNIFEYKRVSIKPKITNDIFLQKLLNCERKISKSSTIINKFEKYYTFLNNRNSYNNIPIEDIKYVLNLSSNLIDKEIFREKYLNHGDISKTNILYSKQQNYLIDFDETTITTPLYDFAVVMVKIFSKYDKINEEKYVTYRKVLQQKYKKYTDDDYKDVVIFYLCKILLEKYYLHEKGIINLFSKKQLEDDYQKYLKMLKTFKH